MNLHKGSVVYYARLIPKNHIYEVCELKIRTVEDTWFVGVDKRDKHAYLLNITDVNQTVFEKRQDALALAKVAQKKYEKEYEN